MRYTYQAPPRSSLDVSGRCCYISILMCWCKLLVIQAQTRNKSDWYDLSEPAYATLQHEFFGCQALVLRALPRYRKSKGLGILPWHVGMCPGHR